jgi:hypothetical protein
MKRLLFFLIVFVHMAPNVGAMTFVMEYNNHTNVIVASGDILESSPEDFEQFLKDNPFDGFSFEIHLDSLGGSLLGGIQLGYRIRELGLTTVVMSRDGPRPVAGRCYSACAYAFIGGKNRRIERDFNGHMSEIGFHQFSSRFDANPRASFDFSQMSRAEREAQRISGLILEYVLHMDVSPELFALIQRATPDELFIPSEEQLRDLRIVQGTGYYSFDIDTWESGVIAFSELSGQPPSREWVFQVTAYCRKGRPYILLSGRPDTRGLSREHVADLELMSDGFHLVLDGQYFHLERALLKFFEGRQALIEVALSPQYSPAVRVRRDFEARWGS